MSGNTEKNDKKFLRLLNKTIASFTEWSNDPIAFLDSDRTFAEHVKPDLDKVGRWFGFRKETDFKDDLAAYEEILLGSGSLDPDDRAMKIQVVVKTVEKGEDGEPVMGDDGKPVMVPVMVPAMDPNTGKQMIWGIDPESITAECPAGKVLLATEPKTEESTVEAWHYMQEHYGEEVKIVIADILILLDTSKEMVEP